MDHFRHYMKSTGMNVNMEYLGDQQLLALQVLSSAVMHRNILAQPFYWARIQAQQ